jgi:hypothetical protein
VRGQRSAIASLAARLPAGAGASHVAGNLPGIVAVRDSKHRDGPVLTFTAREWQSFISGMKAARPGR